MGAPLSKGQLYYLRNREAILARRAEYVAKNKDKIRAYERANRGLISAREKRHYHENAEFRLGKCLRTRLRTLLASSGRRKAALGRMGELVGCSIQELKQHLESKFQPGMTWENYGYSGWHVDHVIPLSTFTLTIREELLKANHYTNLQPLWAEDNLRKSNSLELIPIPSTSGSPLN